MTHDDDDYQTSIEEAAETGCCWIAPDGNIFPCEWHQHLGTAEEIAKSRITGPPNKDDDYYFQADDYLLEIGWLLITAMGTVFCKGGHLESADYVTQDQFTTLCDLNEAMKKRGNYNLRDRLLGVYADELNQFAGE